MRQTHRFSSVSDSCAPSGPELLGSSRHHSCSTRIPTTPLRLRRGALVTGAPGMGADEHVTLKFEHRSHRTVPADHSRIVLEGPHNFQSDAENGTVDGRRADCATRPTVPRFVPPPLRSRPVAPLRVGRRGCGGLGALSSSVQQRKEHRRRLRKRLLSRKPVRCSQGRRTARLTPRGHSGCSAPHLRSASCLHRSHHVSLARRSIGFVPSW